MSATDKIIEKYLNFGGRRNILDFVSFHLEVSGEKEKHKPGSLEHHCLDYILKKLQIGMKHCMKHNNVIEMLEITDTKESIESGYKKSMGKPATSKTSSTKKKAAKKTRKKAPKKNGNLGKLVDHGKVTPRGKSDIYWGREGIDIVFLPTDEKVRIGAKIPDTYKYTDMRFLEDYYGLRAFEFGNWLSQQDRVNYLSGLGLALFDLHKAIGFPPEKISIKNKLAVSFGARGRGKARAHFEPGSFTINLTRYSRPPQENKRSLNFKRVDLILKDGGVGSFAHEYGHALDYYGGLHIEKGDTFCLSGDDSVDPTPDLALLKKNTLRGLMEKLMYKIIWKSSKQHTPYYERLTKGGIDKYFKQRNEIFARAFEVYVHYKLEENKYKDVFLNKTKYNPRYYLTMQEMKRVINEFDALMNALKKHL